MRKTLIGLALSLAFGGTALASDYIVVNSTDPGIKRGQAFDAGARVQLGAGQTLTLMRASGEVTTLKGAAAGVTVPGAKLAAADTARFETLRALVQPPPEAPSGPAAAASARRWKPSSPWTTSSTWPRPRAASRWPARRSKPTWPRPAATSAASHG